MRAEKKVVIFKEIAITKEEKEIVSKIYQIATELHRSTSTFSDYSFASILDMLMSDFIWTEEENDKGEFIVDMKEYYE